MDTGSPHYIKWVDSCEGVNVFSEGKMIRYSPQFLPGGVNVNFAQRINNALFVRTYERGVEDETMSCGTGVVAAAIAAAGNSTGRFNTKVTTPGGELEVSFLKPDSLSAIEVILTGPAVFVFKGEIEL
jgi:diaminopimelate epimerase